MIYYHPVPHIAPTVYDKIWKRVKAREAEAYEEDLERGLDWLPERRTFRVAHCYRGTDHAALCGSVEPYCETEPAGVPRCPECEKVAATYRK